MDAPPQTEPVLLLPARALGDGLLGMVLAHNLQAAGRAVTLYHSQLTELAAWFPKARIERVPEGSKLAALLDSAEALFVGDPTLLPTPRPVSLETRTCLVFSKDLWDRRHPYLHSLAREAQRAFQIPWVSDDNGLAAPHAGRQARHPKRVCLHPFSARPQKNWPPTNFMKLARRLEDAGYEPVFLLAPGEEQAFERLEGHRDFRTAVPGPLDQVASWLRDSGAAIAGDSGIGHLASNVGLPTLSLFRKQSASLFWRPAWGTVRVATPRLRLPGKRGHRLWGHLLTPRQVATAFLRMMEEAAP